MPVRLLNTDFVVKMMVISTVKETMGCQDATAQTFVAPFSVQIMLQTTLANLLQLQKNAMAAIKFPQSVPSQVWSLTRGFLLSALS